jgi:DNA-binding GntR family transcriptional regulator
MMRSDVYQQLKERLFAGDLRTGQFVSQRELAALLGATLNPVREAIRKLEAEGLINVYAQRGIQIVEGGPKAINDAYDYRAMLEANAVRHFARTAGKPDVAAVRGRVERSLDALLRFPEDREIRLAALDCDYQFHKELIDFQGNQIISKHYSLNAARLRLFRTSLGEPLQRLEIACREHLGILDACGQRDAEAAVERLAAHIEISREHTLGVRPMR